MNSLALKYFAKLCLFFFDRVFVPQWQIPGKEQLEIIDSKYISQYIGKYNNRTDLHAGVELQ